MSPEMPDTLLCWGASKAFHSVWKLFKAISQLQTKASSDTFRLRGGLQLWLTEEIPVCHHQNKAEKYNGK